LQGDIASRLDKELEGETAADAFAGKGSKCASLHWLLIVVFEHFALISSSDFSSVMRLLKRHKTRFMLDNHGLECCTSAPTVHLKNYQSM
jgi:hypothetical protein